MPTYPDNSFEKISAVLAERSVELGASYYSLKGEVITLDVAFDPVGPVTWALILHADALARLTGLSEPGLNSLPLTTIVNRESPYGNQAVLQDSGLPLSIALNFLDAALEHAIALGIRSYNYTLDEWAALPKSNHLIPIEPYFEDLKKSWITESLLESDKAVDKIVAWPQLSLVNSLNSVQMQPTIEPAPSSVLNIPSMR